METPSQRLGRVALFTSSFLPYSQTFIQDEIRNHQRYEVDVFTARRANTDRFAHDRVHVGGVLYRLLSISPRFSQLLRTGAYDLIHAHFGIGGARASGFASKHRLPLVITFHGYDVPLLTSLRRFTPQYWGYSLAARRTILQRMTLRLCASEELFQMLRDYGVSAERLRVWRLGIDLAQFSAAERRVDEPRVVMVGRFVEKKGFEYGLRAFADQIQRGRRARLTIVGDGEREARLRAEVAALGIGDLVTFPGVLPPKAVQQLLGESDILMCPSVSGMDGDRESGLIVAKEASASGVVPLGTWHGGIHEIIDDGTTGYLVPERNVTALSDRLGLLLENPALRDRMGRAARTKMEREYDIRARVTQLEDHYDEARALGPGGPRHALAAGVVR